MVWTVTSASITASPSRSLTPIVGRLGDMFGLMDEVERLETSHFETSDLQAGEGPVVIVPAAP